MNDIRISHLEIGKLCKSVASKPRCAKPRSESRDISEVDRRATNEHAPKQMGCAVTFAELHRGGNGIGTRL